MNCPVREIHKRSGFAFNSSKALRGWSQSDRVRVAGFQGGGSEDKPSLLLFVVEECLRSGDRARHPLQVTSLKSDCHCCRELDVDFPDGAESGDCNGVEALRNFYAF